MGAPAQRQLEEQDDDDEATRIAAPGALAGAFSAAVSEHVPTAVADPLNMPGDEWFVGINGVPVGPIRLSELRSKAASGAITKESLVWRDGFEEWRPLKSFPELAAIVEEGLSSTNAALPFAAAAAGAGAGAAAGVARVGTLADPFAAPPAGSVSSSAAAVTGAAVVTDDLGVAMRRPPGGISLAAWVALVVAVLFGITLGFVFFGNRPPAADKIDAPVAKPSGQATHTAPVAAAKQDSQPEETVVAADPKAPAKGSSGNAAAKTATKTETDSKLTGGLKGLGLSGLGASGGPKGPSEGSGATPAGGQLDSGQLQSTVARYTPSVKRGCWQPALDSRDKDAPASARVSVAITISPSGSVQNVSTNGDPRGYRGLANCIAGRVRGWQFPASGGTTTVNVPFVFVAQ